VTAPDTTVAVIGIMTTTTMGIILAAGAGIEILIVPGGAIEILIDPDGAIAIGDTT
jgi:hypothetical protein